jgi:hypothetical protein
MGQIMTNRIDSGHPSTTVPPGQPLRRRGILAAVAGLVAGALAPRTARPALAGTDGDLVLNTTNTEVADTILQVGQVAFGAGYAFVVSAAQDTAGQTGAIEGLGGSGHNSFPLGGDGLAGFGGSGFAAVVGGVGVRAVGGQGGPTNGPGAPGVQASGGLGGGSNGNGGIGVAAVGGAKIGSGVSGVGVQGAGGGAAGSQASGVVGLTNSAANSAVSGQNSGAGDGVLGNSGSGIGVHGVSNAQTAVYGNSLTGVGARGDSQQGPGVIGTSVTNNGVFGLAGQAGNGVFGQSSSGNGVLGQATGGGNGIQGLTTSGTGVYGSAGAGTGVFGVSVSGAGVAGASANNNAVFGDASAAGNGVFARTVNGNGLVAQATGGGNAASFFGNVIVNGNFTVAPGFAKSAVVTFADGTWRRLYATEAPENWFEDYGEAQLANGRARVPIPADFAQAVNTSVPYYVFPVGHSADIEALNVTVRAADHFEVQASGKGVVEGTFGFRIVAKRKGFEGPRFERVTPPGPPPTAPVPARDAAPVAPVPVKLPDLPAGAQEIPPVQPVPQPSALPTKPGR